MRDDNQRTKFIQFSRDISQATRSRESRLKRWFLFDGDRKHVTGGLLLGVYIALLLLAVLWPIEYRHLLTETTMIQTVFNTLLGGVILLVSIVVTIASLGISQELTSIGDQDERIETALEFRGEIEDHDVVDMSPARPGQVIVVMLRIIQQRADDLDVTVTGSIESEFQQDLDRLKEDIETNIKELSETLTNVQAGTTDELLVGLDYDSTWQLHQTYQIQQKYADQLSDDQQEELDELADALQGFMTSREYFKTLYYEREFADLSATLLTVSLPVIVFISYVMLALDTGNFPEIRIFTFSPLTIFINLSYTIALAPYLVLTAYVFRAATVTKRAPAVGPFVLETNHQLSVDSDVLQSDSDT